MVIIAARHGVARLHAGHGQRCAGQAPCISHRRARHGRLQRAQHVERDHGQRGATQLSLASAFLGTMRSDRQALSVALLGGIAASQLGRLGGRLLYTHGHGDRLPPTPPRATPRVPATPCSPAPPWRCWARRCRSRAAPTPFRPDLARGLGCVRAVAAVNAWDTEFSLRTQVILGSSGRRDAYAAGKPVCQRGEGWSVVTQPGPEVTS